MTFDRLRKPSSSLQPRLQRAPVLPKGRQAVSEQRRCNASSFDHSFAHVPVHAPKASARGSRMPEPLKSGVESLSGLSMDDVAIHRNSAEPARWQAQAYALGNSIHLAPGQEQHLPHEAWHVVQQKQGRVASTARPGDGLAVNDDARLESEAECMGAQAAQGLRQHAPWHHATLAAAGTPSAVMQLKKVPTDFGEFETTQFAESEGRGVEITLKFKPDAAKVDATKIALSQSLRKTDAAAAAYAISPNQATKMVASAKSGAGYAIDALAETTNPLYGERNSLSASQALKDTPVSANTGSGAVDLGVNTNYELGHCFKEKPTDAAKKTHPASLWDKPRGGKNKGESKTFETVALAIDGADKDKYYGAVKWGYTMQGTEAAPTVTKSDIELAAKGTPTANFVEAAKLWNAGKTTGTVVVTADPQATVLKGDASGTETLAKGSKLKQLDTSMWGKEPAIKAEVLRADGTGSGKVVYVKNADAKDSGDGTANKKLPV